MTREQAIKVLKDWDGYFIGHSSDDVCDALEMAIKALEPQPCEVSQGLVKDSQGFSQEPCDDCVSRQAVINLPRIKTRDVWGNVIYESVDVEDVRQLPPVTPQPKKSDESEVLDKVRSEIDSHCSDNRDRNDGLYIAMKIIDKYKAEGSEE